MVLVSPAGFVVVTFGRAASHSDAHVAVVASGCSAARELRNITPQSSSFCPCDIAAKNRRSPAICATMKWCSTCPRRRRTPDRASADEPRVPLVERAVIAVAHVERFEMDLEVAVVVATRRVELDAAIEQRLV